MAENNTNSAAYLDGINDGEQWDLSGFDGPEDVRTKKAGWDEATINACGGDVCEKAWGVNPGDEDAWDQACADYNAGCHAGACDQADSFGCYGQRYGAQGI